MLTWSPKLRALGSCPISIPCTLPALSAVSGSTFGTFVQSARFVDEHRNGKPGRLSIHGQERVDETVRLCKMNLAVHGLEGQVSQSNTYYEDPFRAVRQFCDQPIREGLQCGLIGTEAMRGERRSATGGAHRPVLHEAPRTAWLSPHT